jgi:pilus assembly protein CpaB
MNPRQRRGALLLVMAALGAVGVYFSVLTYVADVNSRVGSMASIVTLSRAVAPYEPITPDAVELREIPERWLPPDAVLDARDVVGLVSPTELPAGSYAQRGMFVNRPGIQRGFREVAILVDAETGVAGKVASGDRVDIIATSQVSDELSSRNASVLVSNALVIAVGLPEDVARDDGQGGFGTGRAVPVTFALPVQEALRVAYAESFSVKVRLALRGGGDVADVPPDQGVFRADPASAAGEQ